jgi:hypothetical protein
MLLVRSKVKDAAIEAQLIEHLFTASDFVLRFGDVLLRLVVAVKRRSAEPL